MCTNTQVQCGYFNTHKGAPIFSPFSLLPSPISHSSISTLLSLSLSVSLYLSLPYHIWSVPTTSSLQAEHRLLNLVMQIDQSEQKWETDSYCCPSSLCSKILMCPSYLYKKSENIFWISEMYFNIFSIIFPIFFPFLLPFISSRYVNLLLSFSLKCIYLPRWM